jgi:hypothetical protein
MNLDRSHTSHLVARASWSALLGLWRLNTVLTSTTVPAARVSVQCVVLDKCVI